MGADHRPDTVRVIQGSDQRSERCRGTFLGLLDLDDRARYCGEFRVLLGELRPDSGGLLLLGPTPGRTFQLRTPLLSGFYLGTLLSLPVEVGGESRGLVLLGLTGRVLLLQLKGQLAG
ncbi:hypothetical protein ABZ154_31770 [Streptomyces sp. NPDC006261]|uniref:hypothetical protein n=1 Tax=Streptomyces sp. NPDC006261 TaxID=3156739 RepID=UPI0033AC2A51